MVTLNMRHETRARNDGFTFYAIATVSFLETAVPDYVENLVPFYRDRADISGWLASTWLLEESRHGREARAYVENVWPEFDWQSGYECFLAQYRPYCCIEVLRPSPGLEALARCVTETQAAMIYRCIAEYTCDANLKCLLTAMSKEEVRHYAYFRNVFDYYDEQERNSLWRKARTIVDRSELVKEEDLAHAFQPLNKYWNAKQPFVELTYRQFLASAARVMSTYLPFEAAKRMLFRPLRTGTWHENLAANILAAVVRWQYVKTIKSTLTAAF